MGYKGNVNLIVVLGSVVLLAEKEAFRRTHTSNTKCRMNKV